MKQPPKDHEANRDRAAEHQDDHRLTTEQMSQVKKLIEEVGSIAIARAAIEALEKLRTAA
jgi:hypothetical protein